MKNRITRKISIGTLIPLVDNIIPGPITFKCDQMPGAVKPKPKAGREMEGPKEEMAPLVQWGQPPESLMRKARGPTALG